MALFFVGCGTEPSSSVSEISGSPFNRFNVPTVILDRDLKPILGYGNEVRSIKMEVLVELGANDCQAEGVKASILAVDSPRMKKVYAVLKLPKDYYTRQCSVSNHPVRKWIKGLVKFDPLDEVRLENVFREGLHNVINSNYRWPGH
jgi:hypothetical protein